MQKIIESYDTTESYLYNKTYFYIKGYAHSRDFVNTMRALPLARQLHDGQHRKGVFIYEGREVRLPYVVHVLKVCSTLISLRLNLPDDELDLLYAAALMHDTLEDCGDKLPRGGRELTDDYGLDERVLETVQLLSKRSGMNGEELSAYFNAIKYNRRALLIKLSDRSHNVETLSCMTLAKIHKYVAETREFIYPLCSYGKQHFPEISDGIEILKSKIISLTEVTETLLGKFREEALPLI